MMQRQIKNYFNKADFWFIAITTLAYYILIRQYTGPVEDVFYSYMHSTSNNNLILWDQPIKTITDIIQQQIIDYQIYNGRVITHSIVSLLLSIPMGKECFFIISSIAFSLLLIAILALTRINQNTNNCKVDKYIILLLTCVLIPSPGRTLFGHIAFTANYLWPATCMIWLLLLLNQIINGIQYNKLQLTFITIFALISAALHEGFSLPISAILLLYICFNFKRVPSVIYIIAIAYWSGTLFTCLAPANFNKAEYYPHVTGYGLSFFPKMIMSLRTILADAIIPITIIALLLIVSIVKHNCTIFFKRNIQFFIIIFITIIFGCVIAYCGNHQLTPLAIASIIIIVNSLKQNAIKILVNHSKIISVTIILTLFATYPIIY